MPIYEYRCRDCGFQKEFLQKMSDAPLKDCPECGEPALSKMVTAAGFQLKGSGWYVTDFRSGSKPQAKADDKDTEKPAAGAETKADVKATSGAEDKSAVKSDDNPTAKPGEKSAAETSAKKVDTVAPPKTPASSTGS